MDVGSKRHIASNDSRHVPSWQFYLHCRIEEPGSPGIIFIVRQNVLRHPSEHGTSSMGKHLRVKAYIARLNELGELEVTDLNRSMVDETSLAILNRQGSRAITIVSLQSHIIFDIQISPYCMK